MLTYTYYLFTTYYCNFNYTYNNKNIYKVGPNKRITAESEDLYTLQRCARTMVMRQIERKWCQPNFHFFFPSPIMMSPPLPPSHTPHGLGKCLIFFPNNTSYVYLTMTNDNPICDGGRAAAAGQQQPLGNR